MTLLGGVEVQAQSQKTWAYRVEQRMATSEYDGDVEVPLYRETLNFVEDYEKSDLEQINNIIRLRKMCAEKFADENFENIKKFMKEHHLQTSVKEKDEIADIDKLTKSDLKKQIRKYGWVQIIGADKPVSSEVPIADKYNLYLEKKKLLEDFETGRKSKKERKKVKTPEYMADFIVREEDSIPIDAIKNMKVYCTDEEEKAKKLIYNHTDEKYTSPEVEKYEFYKKSCETRYLVFEYNGRKYARSQDGLEKTLIINEIKKTKKYKYVNKEVVDQGIESDNFYLNIFYHYRKERLVKYGVTTVLDDIDKKIAQLSSVYDQANKYYPLIEKYIKIYNSKRNRMSSKEMNEWNKVVDKAIEVNKKIDNIFVDINKKYDLQLPSKFKVFSASALKHRELIDAITSSKLAIGIWLGQ